MRLSALARKSRAIIAFFKWLIEDLILEKIIKSIITPFLSHPVKSVLAGGPIIVVLFLVIMREFKAEHLLILVFNKNLFFYFIFLLIAGQFNMVWDRVFPPRAKIKKRKPR